MEPTYPAVLCEGSHVRVIAPARSRTMVTAGNENLLIAERHLAELGLQVSYGAHVDEIDRYNSSSAASRVADIHDAFADPNVDAILTVIGGANSNEVLPYLDFDMIAANPKGLCGYSDITALTNAITATTGLVTYSGPHWSSFGMRDHQEQTSDWFRAALMTEGPTTIEAATWFTDDAWFLDQDNRTLLATEGWWVLRPGQAQGHSVGGNLCTLNLLQGTPWMPPLTDRVLMIEDDALSNPVEFRRDLHSLMQLPDAETIRALVIGRFQQASEVKREDLELLIASIPTLADIPILANVDFGHTNPVMTFPIGGTIHVDASAQPSLTFPRQ